MAYSRPVLRRAMIIFVLLAVFVTVPAAFAQEEEKEKYNNILVEMLEAYQKIIRTELDKDVKNLAGNSWSVVSRALSEKILRFTVDPMNPDIFTGVRFMPPAEDAPGYLIVSRRLLDTWKTHPSIAYTVLTRAIGDSASFFLQPEAWLQMEKSSLDSFFMSLGLYVTQAEMIRDRLVPAGFLITPYESFLLDSYEKDQLTSAGLFLEGFSLPVAQAIMNAGAGFEKNGDADALRHELKKIGLKLLDDRNNVKRGNDSREIFPSAIAIHSWLEFTPEILSRIYNKDRKDEPLSFGEVLSQETEYAKLRQLLEASRIKDMPKIEHVLKETRKGFASF